MAGRIGRDNAPVHFDDALFAADLARLPETARRALEEARSRYERDGIPASERRHCHAEHHSGTRLTGCLKVYIPDFAGPWRIVSQIAWPASDELGLEYVAPVSAIHREAPDDETSTSSRTTASTATGRRPDRRQAAGVLPAHAIPKEPHQAGECSMRARGDKALSKGVVLGQSSDFEILDMRCASEPGEQRLTVFRTDGKRVTGLVIANGRRESLYALDLPTAFVIAELPLGVSSLGVPYCRL